MCCGVHSENAWIPSGFVCLLTGAGRRSIFGDSPEYKGDSTQFFGKCFRLGLLGDVSVMRWSRTRLGRDKVGIRALSFPVYYGASALW